ncbi:hypothetical protein [Anaerophilus nitritogenes]|uniref:hypothetical protein n=1 Tax=Anaerophilus nitritogenes TaxID=2498136 RepID=UPI00101D8EA7|nr:hypothetical protein [Anaerophilus nitritogenes]
MEIFMSINNREEVIQLPILPSSIMISSPHNNNVFTSISAGDLKIMGNRGLKSMILSSFFPLKNDRYNNKIQQNKDHEGWEWVEIIESWIDRGIPIRLVVTDTPINIAMTIDNFEYGVQDGTGDIFYTLTLSEFRIIELREG